MSAPPRVIYMDKFSVVDCLKDIGGDWEYILKSDYDELQAKLKSTERELAKWKEPFDQEKFDAAAKQASHKDSLAAMCVYQTALEHALKHHQAKLTETERKLAEIYAIEPVAWVVVRQSVLDVGKGDDVRTGGRPELGYALLENSVTYRNEDQASAAIKARGLPLGWVYMPLSRLLPNLAAPIPPTPTPSQQEALDALDNMDDYARMAGLIAIGPIETLRDFILARPDTEGSGK